MASLLDRLAPPLLGFQSLLSYANAMAAFARGDIKSAAAQLAEIIDASKQIRVAGVSLLIPSEIRANLISSDSSRSDQKGASIPNRYRWLIAFSTGTVISVALLTGIIYALRSKQPPDSGSNVSSSLTPASPSPQIAPPTSLPQPNAAAVSPLKPGTTSSMTSPSLTPQPNSTTSESSKSSTNSNTGGLTSGTSVPITQTPLPQTNSTQNKYSIVLNDRFSFWVGSLVFSPNGRSLACGGRYEVGQTVASNGFRLWKVDYTKEQNLKIATDPRIFGGYKGVVRSVAFSPDGRSLATGSYDATIKLWDLQVSDPQPRVLTGHTKEIYAVVFSPDGQILASAGKDQQIFLWNPVTGESCGRLTETDDINSIAISPNSQLLASGSKDKTVKLWDLTTGKLLRTLTGHGGEVNSVAFSPDGRTLASGSDDKTVKLWTVKNGELLHTLIKHSDKVNTVAFSPDGRTLASGSEDTTINLWEVSDGELRYTRGKHAAAVYSIAFNPVKPYFASGGNDGKVRLWTY